MTALSIDVSLPALPLLTKTLHIPADRAQLTLSLFLLGFGLGQLVVGPASDRFGRRPVPLWGLLGFTLTSVGCARSQGIEALILCRFLQGATACVALAGLAVSALYDRSARPLGLHGRRPRGGGPAHPRGAAAAFAR